MRAASGTAKAERTAGGPGLVGKERPQAQTVVRGALWNYAAAVVACALQLGYTSYTGRTVSAAAFGAFASALSLTQLLGYFANAGLATTVLRSAELTRGLLTATVRLGLFSGLVCCAVLETTAPLWARLWGAAETTGLLRVLALQFLFLPLGAVSVAGLRRLLAHRSAVVVETGAHAAGLLTGTVLLSAGWNPTGLAATSVTTQFTIAALASTLLVRRLPHALGPAAHLPVRYRELAKAAGFLAGHQLAQFATNTTPLWAAGVLLGPVAAGYYSRATLFTGLLLTMLAAGLTRVTTPALTAVRAQPLQHQGAPEKSRATGRETPAFARAGTDVLLACSALSFLPFAFLAGAGPDALQLLLGPGWSEAARLVPLLCVLSAVAVLYAVGLSVDTVCASPRRMAAAQAAAIAANLAGIAVAAGHGLVPLALSALGGAVCGLAVQTWAWHRGGVLQTRRLLTGYAVHAALGVPAYAAGVALCQIVAGRSPVRAAVVLLAVALVVAACHKMPTRLPLYQVAAARGLLPLRLRWPAVAGSRHRRGAGAAAPVQAGDTGSRCRPEAGS
ncbi:oligosaccharide flippase family protein [Streptomyces sp. 142MFCol3.1]|uniref:oligosaccharide flippase family protein n=1 Tax=Streptomyces sp. 142MFCol3.1 TaxID=1172179 RepID=UPI000429B0F3|nr:oligosaccharide flippase family protein [Streptomyces sp. 142MFCol3.1]